MSSHLTQKSLDTHTDVDVYIFLSDDSKLQEIDPDLVFLSLFFFKM